MELLGGIKTLWLAWVCVLPAEKMAAPPPNAIVGKPAGKVQQEFARQQQGTDQLGGAGGGHRRAEEEQIPLDVWGYGGAKERGEAPENSDTRGCWDCRTPMGCGSSSGCNYPSVPSQVDSWQVKAPALRPIFSPLPSGSRGIQRD